MNGDGMRAAAISGVFLLLGLVLGGWVLGSQIKDTKLGDRYVTVRGLTERNVKADVAIWRVDFKEVGDDLPEVFARSKHDKDLALAFLAAQGIPAGDTSVDSPSVTDREQLDFGNNNQKKPRFVVDQTLTVVTKRVDAVSAATQKTSALLEEGVILTSSGGADYNFTGLNTIKPDMITEATKNARQAADRFAADSGSKVGAIRRAEQGIFSITGVNGDSVGQDSGGEGGGSGGASAGGGTSVMKKVRVVTTVDYYLER